MVRNFEQNQPVAFEPAEAGGEAAPLREEHRPAPRSPARGRYGKRAMLFAAIASRFWIGVWCAYLWGYFGPRGLRALEIQQYALFGAAILLPPLLFVAIAGAFALAHRMGGMAEALHGATENLFVTDESIARSAARLGRAVRHELDALNAGLDGAYGRLRALEAALENQIAAMDGAGPMPIRSPGRRPGLIFGSGSKRSRPRRNRNRPLARCNRRCRPPEESAHDRPAPPLGPEAGSGHRP